MRAEQPRGRLDADDGVVARVLLRVDRVVADRPAERRGVERERGPARARRSRRPAHQRAPGEGEAEHRLRPRGDALHQGIDRDDDQRGEAQRDREPVEAEQHREADERLRDEKDGGGAARRRGPKAAAGRACARPRRRACGRECRCRCSRRRASRSRRRGTAARCQRFGPRWAATPASAADCQQGASSNCQPIGRSQRASCTKGSAKSGVSRSTRLAGRASGSSAAAAAPPLKADPAGSGWACAPPPPCAACSFIFFICAATLQALVEKPTLLACVAFS